MAHYAVSWILRHGKAGSAIEAAFRTRLDTELRSLDLRANDSPVFDAVRVNSEIQRIHAQLSHLWYQDANRAHDG